MRSVQPPLLWAALCLLPLLSSLSPFVRGQTSSSVYRVTGELSGADFRVVYAFDAVAHFSGVGFDHTPSAAYLITSVSGQRTYTNTSSGATVRSNLTLLPFESLNSNSNYLFPFTNGPTPLDTNLFDGVGVGFALSTPAPIDSADNCTQLILYSSLSFASANVSLQYMEQAVCGGGVDVFYEFDVDQSAFSASLAVASTGPYFPAPSSSGAAAATLPSSAPVDIAVSGNITGVDFTISYSLVASAQCVAGSLAACSAYLATAVEGTRTFTNTSSGAVQHASLTLLPVDVNLDASSNLLFPFPGAAVVDQLGLDFQLSPAEETVDYGNDAESSLVHLFVVDSQYEEQGSNYGDTNSSFTATLLSSAPTGAPTPAPSTAIAVTGYLAGANSLVSYSFTAYGFYVGGAGNSIVYIVTALAGTRTYTNATTGVSTVADLTLEPVGSINAADNNIFPFANAASDTLQTALFTDRGLAFRTSTAQEASGQGGYTSSTFNLVAVGGTYSESEGFAYTNASFSATFPALTRIQVSGVLHGAGYEVGYSFVAEAHYIAGVGEAAFYFATAVQGTRTFTNTSSGVTETASLTLCPPVVNDNQVSGALRSTQQTTRV